MQISSKSVVVELNTRVKAVKVFLLFFATLGERENVGRIKAIKRKTGRNLRGKK